MKILATSDIHGNKALIYLVLQKIRKEKIDALIIAGDIVAKGFHIFGHIHEAFGNVKIDNTICCNASCLWTDWLLRGYIIDTEDRSIKRIEEEISLREIGRIQMDSKMSISKRVHLISSSPTLAITAKAKQMKLEGIDVGG